MTMDSRHPLTSEIWVALDERKEAIVAFGDGADAWLNEHPAIRARLDCLTAHKQSDSNAEAVLAYIRSEAHPAALFMLGRVRDLSTAGLDPNPVMQLIRTVFAAGYQQALRDAMDEEIVV